MTHLGNVLRNKHTKFEQDRSNFSLSNFEGTPKKFKIHRGGGIFFFEIQKSEK